MSHASFLRYQNILFFPFKNNFVCIIPFCRRLLNGNLQPRNLNFMRSHHLQGWLFPPEMLFICIHLHFLVAFSLILAFHFSELTLLLFYSCISLLRWIVDTAGRELSTVVSHNKILDNMCNTSFSYISFESHMIHQYVLLLSTHVGYNLF